MLVSSIIVLEFELLLFDEVFVLYDFIMDVNSVFDFCSAVEYLGYNGINVEEVFFLVLHQAYQLV